MQPQKNGQSNPQNNGQNNPQNNRKDTYVYPLDGNLYINLTNKCSNGCDFCVRNERDTYFGHALWILHGDPTAEKVIEALKKYDLSQYKEVVFCGFGEPTYKMEEMCAVAEYLHGKGARTRLNTNGQGDLIQKRSIAEELKGKIDFVSVSLNAPDSESYQKICRSMFRDNAYPSVIEFAKSCKRAGIETRFTIVDSIGEEQIAACKKVAESAGIPLYVRKYIEES